MFLTFVTKTYMVHQKKEKTLILTDCYVISELFKCALPKLAGQHWKFLC